MRLPFAKMVVCAVWTLPRELTSVNAQSTTRGNFVKCVSENGNKGVFQTADFSMHNFDILFCKFLDRENPCGRFEKRNISKVQSISSSGNLFMNGGGGGELPS